MSGPNPPAVVARNQEIIAEAMHWPPGALDACRKLEAANPGWSVAWLNENTISGFERPAGYWAVLHGMHEAERFAATPAELETLMRGVPEHDWNADSGCAYCLDQVAVRLRRAGLESELSRSRLHAERLSKRPPFNT